MRIPRQRVKRTRLYVVAVEVEMVIPADDPSEPCAKCIRPEERKS